MSGWRCLRAQWLHPPAPCLHHWPRGGGGAAALQVHRAAQGYWQCWQDLSARGCSIRALWHGSGTEMMPIKCQHVHIFFKGSDWSRSWPYYSWQGGMDSSSLCSKCWVPGCCKALGWEWSFSRCRKPFFSQFSLKNSFSQIVTKNGRTALWYAASEGHNNVLYYLLREKHDSYSLLEDRRVSYQKSCNISIHYPFYIRPLGNINVYKLLLNSYLQ